MVSLILNIHNESRYLVRTLLSLERSVRFARRVGIDSELIIVMDRPDAATERLARDYDYSAFGEARMLKVDNGSLGPSRNDGIAEARGCYAWLCDGDDLVSYNALAAMYRRAETSSVPCAVFPQYVLLFGDAYYLTAYEGTDAFPDLDFVATHPFVSRCFALRETFARTPFADLRLSRGFAFEDWHFNASVYAKGVECVVAAQTILFYRQREGSLLRAANTLSTRQIPHSPLFNPAVYRTRWGRPLASHESAAASESEPMRSLLEDDVCREMIWDAAQVDPAIDIRAIERGSQHRNIDNRREPAIVYGELCRLVEDRTFTDVAIVSSLDHGGENYLTGVLGALASLQASTRCLLVAGETGIPRRWLEKLPQQMTFIDLPTVTAPLVEEHRHVVLLRLLLACAPGARLHLEAGAFSHSFFQRMRECLTEFSSYYYRFSDPVWPAAGRLYPLGAGFEFVSTNLDRLAGVISDNHDVIQHGARRFGYGPNNWHCIYRLHEPAAEADGASCPRGVGAPWRRRLLWVSGSAAESPQVLLRRFAERLGQALPDVGLEVYGRVVECGFDAALPDALPNLAYRGGFGAIGELPLAEYDALVYASFSDGIPDILLEVMGRGLPVIAPAVGGVPEIVIDGATGRLVRGAGSYEDIVEQYIETVRRLYEDAAATTAMAQRARELVESRHGARAFRRRVAEVFLGGLK